MSVLRITTVFITCCAAASYVGAVLDDDFATDQCQHVFELTQAKNLQRQERVQHECDSYDDGDKDEIAASGGGGGGVGGYAQNINEIPDEQLDHLLVDEKHRFLYCYVPKVNDALQSSK